MEAESPVKAMCACLCAGLAADSPEQKLNREQEDESPKY